MLPEIQASEPVIDANKFVRYAMTLVTAGEIVVAEAKRHGSEIIPVDSEHSAIFQSISLF